MLYQTVTPKHRRSVGILRYYLALADILLKRVHLFHAPSPPPLPDLVEVVWPLPYRVRATPSWRAARRYFYQSPFFVVSSPCHPDDVFTPSGYTAAKLL